MTTSSKKKIYVVLSSLIICLIELQTYHLYSYVVSSRTKSNFKSFIEEIQILFSANASSSYFMIQALIDSSQVEHMAFP